MPAFRALRLQWIPALLVVSVSGCAWLPQSGQQGQLRTSGMLSLESQGGRLETCAGTVHQVVEDASLRAVFDQVAMPNQTRIFVDLRGELLEDNSIRPRQVVRMGARGDGCAGSLVADSQWVAEGERPQWLVRVGLPGLQVTTLGDTWQPLVTEQLPDGARGFRTLEGEPVELWVYPQPCVSRRGGHYYQYTARLLTAGESFAGCAYPGALAADQPPR